MTIHEGSEAHIHDIVCIYKLKYVNSCSGCSFLSPICNAAVRLIIIKWSKNLSFFQQHLSPPQD